MAESKGRNVPRNRKKTKSMLLTGGTLGAGIGGTVGPGISGMMDTRSAEKDYPTSAPSTSKRPKARAEPVRPKARPAKIEQEAAETGAVARSNAAAERRAREEAMTEAMMGMKYGGKVKKMGDGGMCRGMGAATRGGNYKMG